MTVRTAAAFSSGLLRRVVGFPGVVSFGMSPSSVPNDGDSKRPRAVHSLSPEIGLGKRRYAGVATLRSFSDPRVAPCASPAKDLLVLARRAGSVESRRPRLNRMMQVFSENGEGTRLTALDTMRLWTSRASQATQDNPWRQPGSAEDPSSSKNVSRANR